MHVRLIIRSPGTGHSLENLFNRLIAEFQKSDTIRPHKLILPHISTSLQAVWRNLQYTGRQTSMLTHITGDVHYIALATASRHTVLTIPDCVLLTRTPTWSIRYLAFWLLWYYLPIRRAAIVTTISDKTRRELHSYLGKVARKVVVIPCHYDPMFSYRPKRFHSPYPVILHVGTAPHKNLKRLIEAIAGIRCKLLIVGKLADGDLQLLTKYRIDYDNYIDSSQEEMLTLYERCDVVAFVSLYEGFGLPILEGQVVGRPVLTSNISPMNDIGGSGACYVDPYNVADIRQGIQRIFQDEAYRNRLILEGQQNTESYSIERVAKRYMALYESIHQTMPQE